MATFTLGTTAGVTATEVVPNAGYKIVAIRVPATFVWNTDSIVADLNLLGGNKIAGFLAWEETTAGSVVIAATGTTSVTAHVLTFVSTGSGVNTVGGTLMIWVYG